MTDTAHTRGVDSNGRAVLATDYMWAWWLAVLDHLDFTPTIVQGAFMSRVPGGGADASAGYHDLGGCFDLRTWDLTPAQLETLVRTLRLRGAAAWRRDHEHGGFEPHLHFVLGTDSPLADGAAGQWRDYRAGFDGLASRGPDYEWRPSPLVLTPPEDEVDDATIEKIAQRTAELVLSAAVGKDQTTVKQVLNKLKTWLGRQAT